MNRDRKSSGQISWAGLPAAWLFGTALVFAGGTAPALAAPGRATAAATRQPAAGSGSNMRPYTGDFTSALYVNGAWHLTGSPGRIVSRDTVFTMKMLELNEHTHVGVATGDPRVQDAHNVMTADRVTFVTEGTPAQRKAILEGHVRIVHHPDPNDRPEPSGDNLSDLFSHDVVLTCDQATYFYRLKTGSASGHLLMAGQGTENNKPVEVTLTADRLDFDDQHNTYQAIGNAVIHDGSRTITSPKITAVTTQQNGRRQVSTVEFEQPVHMTGLFDEGEETAPPAPPAGAAKPAVATSGPASRPAPRGGTPPAGGTPATPPSPAPSSPAPTSPAPTAPPPASPAPASPVPANPAPPASPQPGATPKTGATPTAPAAPPRPAGSGGGA